MDAVVLGVGAGRVVDAAAGDDGDVCVFADEEVVVDGVVEIPHRQQHGDVHRFVFDARLDDDVDAVFILFGDDLDVCVRVAGDELTVFGGY